MKERTHSLTLLGRVSRQYRYLRGRSRYSQSLAVLIVALTQVYVSRGSPWLLYRVGDPRSHHFQWATTAFFSLVWCNDAESGITFSRSKDERRGILSALHQS